MSFGRTTVTAAMLEVCCVVAVQRLKVMFASKLMCVELHQSRYRETERKKKKLCSW